MRFILNFLYLALLFVYLPVIIGQRLLNNKKRPSLWDRFWGKSPVAKEGERMVWFHAVSLGEVNAIERVVNEFHLAHPNFSIAISVTTETGLNAALQKYGEHNVFLFPFDFTWSVYRVLDRLNPEALVLAELEIWPNLLEACEKKGVKTCVINGRLTDKTFQKYLKLPRFARSTFSRLNLVCAQTADYAERFAELGVLKRQHFYHGKPEV